MKILVRAVLLSLLSVPLLAQVPTTLTMTIDDAAADRAAGTIPVRVTITNVTDRTVPGIVVRVSAGFPGDARLVASDTPGWSCTAGELAVVQCTRASLAPRESAVLGLTMRFPQRAGRAAVQAYATYEEPGGPYFAGNANASAVMFRPFLVTNTDDDGDGSLRTAIGTLNRDSACPTLPCRIEFVLPAGVSHAIVPRTALPTIAVPDVEIDAAPHDVELIGTSIAQGNGLYLRGARVAVRGLTISRFPDNGILYLPTVRGSSVTIEKNHIRGNGARGIVVEKGILLSSAIRDNTIEDNFRSGIFLLTEPEPSLPTIPVLRVTDNRIRGNGASGIFVGPNAEQVFIGDNVIERNAHFGIAVSRTATLVTIGVNRIAGHPLPAIDVGLDGPSPSAAQLTGAVYDVSTNTTAIAGSGPPSGGMITFTYAFYANTSADVSGQAEAEEFLGYATAVNDGRFVLRVPGDLRGRWITAAVTEASNFDGTLFYRSGELLRAIRVQ